jgi:hypothetical protein
MGINVNLIDHRMVIFEAIRPSEEEAYWLLPRPVKLLHLSGTS